jgi:hypothetical protein
MVSQLPGPVVEVGALGVVVVVVALGGLVGGMMCMMAAGPEGPDTAAAAAAAAAARQGHGSVICTVAGTLTAWQSQAPHGSQTIEQRHWCNVSICNPLFLLHNCSQCSSHCASAMLCCVLQLLTSAVR